MPDTVSDACPLIHLAQINKLILVKRLFSQVVITSAVRREAVEVGAKLGHPDAIVIGKAIEEGWINVEAPKRLGSAVKRLAADENISLADSEILLLARSKGSDILVEK